MRGRRDGSLAAVTRSPHPSRHVLRPGVVVVPREPHQLVVGHDRARVTLPATPESEQLLARLAAEGARSPGGDDPPEAWRLWRRLDDAGLLVTDAGLRRAREVVTRSARSSGGGPGIATADAVVLTYGDEAADVLRARLSARAVVHGPEDVRSAAVAALAAAGVPVAEGAGRAVVHLVIGDVDPAAGHLADLLREGTPHLVLVRDTSAITVGPFVVPGHTACTGCLEATRADQAPDQGVLRLLRARQLRERTLPTDPAVQALALAAAVQDLVVWAAGEEPSTWSATRTFTVGGREERVELRRHPRCGCAWDALGVHAG